MKATLRYVKSIKTIANTCLVRSFFVIHAARELQLIFPSSYATATTIRSIHLAVDGADMAKQKMRALSYGFGYAMVCRVLSQFAVGVLWVSAATDKYVDNK